MVFVLLNLNEKDCSLLPIAQCSATGMAVSIPNRSASLHFFLLNVSYLLQQHVFMQR